jgi:hypothetical protein
MIFMASSSNPKDIWRKAGTIAKGRKDPHEVWTELKAWSIREKDPVAAKAAIFEFLAVHGTNPNAAALLPEVFRDAAHISSGLPADEKRVLTELADQAFSALRMSYEGSSRLNPRKLDMNVPVRKGKPELSLHFSRDGDRGIFSPLAPTIDADGLIRARDTMLRVNDMVLSMNMPVGSGSREEGKKGEVRSMDMAARSDRGEELIQSLVEKMKGYSSDSGSSRMRRETPSSASEKRAKPKKKGKPKKAASKKAKPAKKKAKKKTSKKKSAAKKTGKKSATKKKTSKKKSAAKKKGVKKKPTKKKAAKKAPKKPAKRKKAKR